MNALLPEPVIVVHGAAQAQAVLAHGRAVTLLSAPGAGLVGGCGWWHGVIAAARAAHPGVAVADVLDCGAGPGAAMAALRLGQRFLVLDPGCPAFGAVSAAAGTLGAAVLGVRPVGLDLGARGAMRHLPAYLDDPGAFSNLAGP